MSDIGPVAAIMSAPSMAAPTSAPLPPPSADESWRSLLRDVFPRDPHSIGGVTIQFLRAPLEALQRLSSDTTYRGYWNFLIACLGALPIFMLFVLPWLGKKLTGLPFTIGGTEMFAWRLKLEVIQVAGILILSPLQYYLCRALSNAERTPRAYFKMCVLSVSYGTMLRMATGILSLCAGLAMYAWQLYVTPQHAMVAEEVAGSLAVVIFVTAAHRRFWCMSWFRAFWITVLIATVSWAVVYPALWQAVAMIEQLGVMQRLGS